MPIGKIGELMQRAKKSDMSSFKRREVLHMMRRCQPKDRTCRREKRKAELSGNHEALASTAVMCKANKSSNKVNTVVSYNEKNLRVILIGVGESENIIRNKALFSSIEEIDLMQVNSVHGCLVFAKYEG